MATIEKALQIAARAHEGQVDKEGLPYILHPLRVMTGVDGPEAKIVAVLQKRVDGLLAGLENQVVVLEQKGLEQKVFSFAELGLNTEGLTILVSKSTLEGKPDLVARFVRATRKAIELSRANPDKAVAAAMAEKPAGGEVPQPFPGKPGLSGSTEREDIGGGDAAVIEDPLSGSDVPPGVAVTRIMDDGLVGQMSEYAIYWALRHHRDIDRYSESQRGATWKVESFKDTIHRRIGIMGLGTIGQDTAQKFVALGFPTAGWSR